MDAAMRFLLSLTVIVGPLFVSAFASEAPRLELLWETEPVFSFPECVVYDPARNVLYVSNIGETPDGEPHNGDGYVSVVSLNGEIITEKYIGGLNDPKGMDIYEDTLWVNDRDAIVQWDIASTELVKRFELQDIVFLNDIGVGPDGEVFSNDADGHKVLALKDGKWDVFWDNTEKQRPNGIWVESDRILLAMNWSHQFIALDRTTKDQTVLLDGIGAGDGIEPVGNGGYLVTDYLGQVFYLSPEGEGSVLMDSRDDKLTADLEYIADQQLVIIPRHRNHTIAAYRLVWE